MAVTVVIAAIAAYESTSLLIIFGFICCWLMYKQKHFLFVVGVLLVGMLSFLYIKFVIPQPATDISVTEITWTDNYRINGRYIRGFAISEADEKWYVQLKMESEQKKIAFMNTSLVGMTLKVETKEITEKPMSHQYAFNMDGYIKSNGAVGQFEVEQYEVIEKKETFLTFMSEKRFNMKQHIQNTFPISLQSEAEALLIGSREQMPSDMQNAYQTLGITHLFAISGLHVALIVWLVYESIIRVGVRRETANWLLIILLPLYGLIAGGAPSVWRSISVTEIVLISMFFKKKLAIDDAFSISFIGFILLSPWVIYQMGFQLSYLAAFSLIYSAVLLRSGNSYLVQSLIITAVCQLAVYPLLIYQFYEISMSSFLANLVFVPLFSFLILPINLMFLFLTFISSSLSQLLFSIYEPLRNLLDDFILYLGSLPYQLWNPMKPTLLLLFIAYISVFLFFISMEKKQKRIVSTFILLLPICVIHFSPFFNSSTIITFLNVGQGDCIIIEMPYRKEVIMIDTGGVLRFDEESWKETKEIYEIGRQVVVPFLKGRGITQIDTLVLTHADADHMEGAEEILREVRVEEIHVSPGSIDKEVMSDLMVEVEKQEIDILEKKAGDQIDSTYFHLQYLHPMDTEYEGNNDSLVLSMRNNYFHGLYLGDLEKEGELGLVREYSKAFQNITLLKLGHHGSKTSSEQSFLEWTKPSISIITAGFGNRYGHPHPEVVKRLNELNLSYLQTGKDGTIEVEITKNGEVFVTTP